MKTVLALICAAVLMAAMPASAKDSLFDIEYFNINSSLESGADASGNRMVGVAFAFINKTEGPVKWENSMLECSCELLVNDRVIGNVRDVLRSYRDKFWFTIPKNTFAEIQGAKAKVVCHSSPNGTMLEATKRISLK